jgi:DNA repair exonuclease SbcCD ATPase subunit
MITEMTARFNNLKGRIDFLQDAIEKKEEQINSKLTFCDNLAKAQWILTEVQKKTQERFKEKIDPLVTAAIKAVYERPFGFELIFERKRDKMECKPMLYEVIGKEKEYYDDPENELGGGIIDICSIALRIVLWTMEKPRSRNFFLLDEPGKNLGALITLFGQMIKEISHRMNLQFLIITHDDALIEVADRVWQVEHDGRESIVQMLSTN